MVFIDTKKHGIMSMKNRSIISMADYFNGNGKYVFETQFSPKRVNGVNFACYGKEAIITFFEETPSFPSTFNVELDKDGKIEQKDFIDEDVKLVRTVQSRIVMDKEEALMLFKYLVNSIEGDLNVNNGE